MAHAVFMTQLRHFFFFVFENVNFLLLFRAIFREFSGFFFFIISNSCVQATGRTIRPTMQIFATGGLYDTIKKAF